MKIAVFSDIHGNHLALKKCLLEVANEDVSQLFFLGDCCGYFSGINEVIEQLISSKVSCLLGNHDAMLLGKLHLDETRDQVYRLANAMKVVKRENRHYMESWLPFREVNINGKRILMIHGSPRDPLQGYIYPDTELEDLRKLSYDIVFMGHTHRPFIRNAGTITFVNVGSVGLPRDIGNLGSYVIANLESNTLEIKRFEMAVEEILSGEPSVHPDVVRCLYRKKNSNDR